MYTEFENKLYVITESSISKGRSNEFIVKEAIKKAAPGGGYILSDNHGEIPWQVPEDVLLNISKSVHKWGKYPLNWIKND